MRIASNGDIVLLVRAGTLKPVSHQITQVNGQERVVVTFEVVGEQTGVAVSFQTPAPAVLLAHAFVDDVPLGESCGECGVAQAPDPEHESHESHYRWCPRYQRGLVDGRFVGSGGA